jgi:ADP-ribosylglycohydrolase
MLGAIIGDIIGSRFEFDRGGKSRDFELFTKECEFTDDTVMTIAVAEALLDAGKDADENTVKEKLVSSLRKWGRKYPDAGYGGRFRGWLSSWDPKPYGSYGNGSGMRVSSVGWLYDTLERTREVARWTAEITHNHPEGIKGAESVASAIFLARNHATMEEISEYIEKEFSYDFSRSLDEIRPAYKHVEDCMHTMPEAFECFFESESYEACIRNVMYIGGDTDTLAAIAGAVAGAFWEIPVSFVAKADEYLDDDIKAVIKRFDKAVNGDEDKAMDGTEHRGKIIWD